MRLSLRPLVFVSSLLWIPHAAATAQRSQPVAARALQSAPISNVRYDITFDTTTARTQTVKIGMAFTVTGAGHVLLSLPSWTPGAYEISNFARWVSNFSATADGKELHWDKADYDTWRIDPKGAKSVAVSFDFRADTLDNAMAWSRPDFALLNGTNIFFYAEARGFNFTSQVTVHTQADWLVATGMQRSSSPNSYTAGNFHDLVDMPFFIGRFDYDSAQVAQRWTHLASYPAGSVSGRNREMLWDHIQKMLPPEIAVFHETPWDTYTTFIIVDSSFGGGSALEHQNSHVGIYSPALVGNVILSSITAHEIFHAWNVKRLRPADLFPYRYDASQPTPWLWVSEGITDYYADLSLLRGAIIDSAQFFEVTAGKISTIEDAPPFAVEDASLETWIKPTDGTGFLYYPKGSLAGFMLDILIRDASDNRRSLDMVLRELYQRVYKSGRGFSAQDWWSAVTRAAGGRSFVDFNARYIDGREPYPWATVLALAGMRQVADTIREPRMGISSASDSSGILVTGVIPGGAFDAAGVRVGDYLLKVGEVTVSSQDFGAEFRSRYAKTAEATTIPVSVRRGTETVELKAPLRFEARVEYGIVADPGASPKAARIRTGLLRGTVGS